MENLTQEYVVSRGIQAEAILNDEAFMSFIGELAALYMQNVMQTAPENWKERESIYKQYHAIQDVLGVMKSYVSAKDQIVAGIDTSDNQETD